ncbi:MAG: topoisomerase DNA-binding C4 zinc finger domain-containing protein, partial [Gammaproteobacteria bacterium]|nr:topoisomerase DNA-binding C4 zinc finger domain-containing protein [Gammaproteobacteria bacterium]
ESRLTKPKRGLYDCTPVMKADQFIERFNKDVKEDDILKDVVSVSKIISRDSLKLFAEKIVLHHKPITIDYIAKFGLKDNEQVEEGAAEYKSAPECPVCARAMVQREAKKGKNSGKKFWGCVQYPKCRGVLDVDEAPEDLTETEPLCPKCNGAMIKRVSKKGKNIGNEFWGCQSFPKCRGVVSIKTNSE